MSIRLLVLFLPDGYAMLMSSRPNKAETAVHGCHCPGDMALSMRKTLVRALVSVRVCHLLYCLYKWVPANLMLGDNPAMDWHPIQGE